LLLPVDKNFKCHILLFYIRWQITPLFTKNYG